MSTSQPINKYLRPDECNLTALIKAAERTGDAHLREQLARVVQQMHQDALSLRALDAAQSHALGQFFTDTSKVKKPLDTLRFMLAA